jgi:tetratricopeptide (TPR) repeat protein
MVNGEQPLIESWKDISAYLKRSTRTCRRWEAELGLPIHRLDGTPKARVFAYPRELDRWISDKLHHIEASERAQGLPAVFRKDKLFLVAGAVVAAALALGGAAVFVPPLIRQVPAPVPGQNPILAIFPFENPSGDKTLESWRLALPNLLMTDLYQSRYLAVVPVRRMYARLKDMKLAEAPRFSAGDLAAFFKRFEQDFTATGRIEKVGDGIAVEITLRSEKAAAEPPRVLRMNARDEQALLDQADALSREIKGAVGLTRRQIAADVDLPLRRIATASAEAMKLYSQADWPREWGILPDMGPALEKALVIDPEFGLARKLMYEAYDSSRTEDLVRSYEKALSLAGRMSEREFLLLQARFYHFCRYQDGFAKMSGAGIPAEAIERLKPKTRGEALRVLERLAALYPGFLGSQSEFVKLVDIYMEAEEWDKAIAALEIVAPLTAKGVPANTQTLIRCYLAKGQVDKAEAALASFDKSVDPRAVASSRREIALKKRQFDEVLANIESSYGDAGPKGHPYGYHTARGYVLWLADDLAGAEKAYRTVIPGAGPEVEAQRAMDLVALSLSQGKISQALAEAGKGLEIAKKDPGLTARGLARQFHYFSAYLYRLAGRLPEALEQANAACLDYQSPSLLSGLVVKLLSLRGLILLESGLSVEFERLLGEIKTICAREACPKLMRAYHYLRGLQEFRRDRGYRAVSELQTAIDLSWPPTGRSDPSHIFFALGEVQDSLGRGTFSINCYEEIARLTERESIAGDLYALSFYRAAKYYDDRWTKGMFRPDVQVRARAVDRYRKFLGLFGGADPLFAAQVQDAKKRLAALGSD